MSWQWPNNGSRMNREVHVRFWESPEVKLLRATRQKRPTLQRSDVSFRQVRTWPAAARYGVRAPPALVAEPRHLGPGGPHWSTESGGADRPPARRTWERGRPWPLSAKAAVTADMVWRLFLTRSGSRMCIAARANVQFPRAQPTNIGFPNRCSGPKWCRPVPAGLDLSGLFGLAIPGRAGDCHPDLGNWVAISVAILPRPSERD
jgi:hypothetical protein